MQQTIVATSERKNSSIFKKISFIDLDKKIGFAVLVFLIMNLAIKGEFIITIVPFLALGYLLGFSYLLIAVISGLASIAVFNQKAMYLYILLSLSFLLIILFTRIFKLNIYNRVYLSVFLSEIISRFFYIYLLKESFDIILLIIPLASCLLTVGLASLSMLSEYKTNKIYPYKAAATIVMITIAAFICLNFSYLKISLSFILVAFGILMIANLFDYTYAPTLIIGSVILYYIFVQGDITIAFTLALPAFLANIAGRKGKYQALILFNLLSFLMLYLSYNKIELNYLIMYGLISFLYIIIPSSFTKIIKEKIYNPSHQYQTYLRKVKEVEGSLREELGHISQLFEMVSNQYQCEEETKRTRKQTDQVYRSLCINCPKNKICYQNGDVKLVKLFFKGIEGALTKEEELKIEKECMKPSRFFALTQEFKNDFYREYKYHAEYQELKKALSKQVLGFKELIDNYVTSLNVESKLIFDNGNKKIKDALEQAQFEVVYVNSFKNFQDLTIELGIKALNEQEINIKAIPVIEKVLDIDLVASMIRLTSAEGFYKVEIKSRNNYEIIHGVHQLHKENEASGDSYLSYQNEKFNIYAISDGMGSGKEAQNESRTTIKLLKGLIETGMNLNYGIGMINSLLKVKNRYDNYATLDILSINHRDLKANFTKNGAANSFIYRNGKLICIDITSLPVGIVEDLDAYNFEYHLQKDDLIIMFSDGVTCNQEQLIKYIATIESYHPQVMAREIATKFTPRNLKDDSTVMVIKVISNSALPVI